MKTVFSLVFLAIMPFSNCIAGIADLSIELEFNTTNGVVVERQGGFIARIKNNGPDIAGIDSNLQLPITMSSGIIRVEPSLGLPLEFAPSVQNNNSICNFTTIIGSPPPGGTVSYVFGFDVPPIAVGEIIECHGMYVANFQSGSREVTWRILNSPNDDDPNDSNDSQTVIFGFPPISIPTNNSFFLYFLFLFTLFLGRKSLQK